MDEGQTARPTAKSLIILVLAVIVAAVVITLIQSLILGRANPAITGGIVGAICAAFYITKVRKKS